MNRLVLNAISVRIMYRRCDGYCMYLQVFIRWNNVLWEVRSFSYENFLYVALRSYSYWIIYRMCISNVLHKILQLLVDNRNWKCFNLKLEPVLEIFRITEFVLQTKVHSYPANNTENRGTTRLLIPDHIIPNETPYNLH